MNEHCKATTKTGSQCRHPATPGSAYCSRHTPKRPAPRADSLPLRLPPSIMLGAEIDRSYDRVRWLSAQIDQAMRDGIDPATYLAKHSELVEWERKEKQLLTKLLETAIDAGIDPVVVGGATIFVRRMIDAITTAGRATGLSEEKVRELLKAAGVFLRETRPNERF